jgi:gamma-glutamyltranspeptidase/glutathione hydrolase
MSPTLVFKKGTKELALAAGSPGGATIINYVAKVLVGTLDWQLDVQQASACPISVAATVRPSWKKAARK